MHLGDVHLMWAHAGLRVGAIRRQARDVPGIVAEIALNSCADDAAAHLDPATSQPVRDITRQTIAAAARR